MKPPLRFLPLLVGIGWLAGLKPLARAQETTPADAAPPVSASSAPDSTPAATTATTTIPAEQPAYPPAALPSAASSNLFPAAGPQLPPARRPTGRAPGTRGKRGQRAGDLLAQEADADPLEVRVAFRRAKTIAMVRDPGMADLLRQASRASTDPEKRAWLKQYYTRLFAQVRRIDSSPAMIAHVDLLSKVAEQRYDPKRRELAGEEDLVNGGAGGRRGRGKRR